MEKVKVAAELFNSSKKRLSKIENEIDEIKRRIDEEIGEEEADNEVNMVTQTIKIPPISLKWSEWTSWNDLKIDARSGNGVKVPNKQPGVYEVKYINEEERLTIGKTSDLRMRIKQGLVKGKTPHSAGEKIREKEDSSKIVVRWALTDRPAAVEEALHKQYSKKFKKLPKYVEHT